MSISIIIPAYNEEELLPETLNSLDRERFWDEIIVVDDGSTDQTSQTKLPDHVHLVRHDQNFGKGKALQTGIRKSKGDIILFLDADLGETAALSHRLVQPILNSVADVTIAKFTAVEKNGGFGLVKGIAKLGIKMYTGLNISEPLSGQRCFRRDVLKAISHFHVGFGIEVAMTLDLLRAGYHILEIEVPFRHRALGKSWKGFIHRGHECVDIIQTFWIKK